jgi:hypothetical protein
LPDKNLICQAQLPLICIAENTLQAKISTYGLK